MGRRASLPVARAAPPIRLFCRPTCVVGLSDSHGGVRMPTRWQFILAATASAMVVAAPLVYSSHHNAQLRNLRVVEDGVLYRSGQLTPAGFERVLHDHGIKTVVTLRAARTAGL